MIGHTKFRRFTGRVNTCALWIQQELNPPFMIKPWHSLYLKMKPAQWTKLKYIPPEPSTSQQGQLPPHGHHGPPLTHHGHAALTPHLHTSDSSSNTTDTTEAIAWMVWGFFYCFVEVFAFSRTSKEGLKSVLLRFSGQPPPSTHWHFLERILFLLCHKILLRLQKALQSEDEELREILSSEPDIRESECFAQTCLEDWQKPGQKPVSAKSFFASFNVCRYISFKHFLCFIQWFVFCFPPQNFQNEEKGFWKKSPRKNFCQ